MSSVKVAIQGGQGSYHQQVFDAIFGDRAEYVACDNFLELFNALKNGKVDYALMAIANNRYGFIDEPYALLMDDAGKHIKIVGEYTLPIAHQLLGVKGSSLDQVQKVYSQLPALGQCTKFLETHLSKAQIIETSDTAGAAEFVSAQNDPTIAAIASSSAGELYGLDPIAKDVQDDEKNLTRFLVLQNADNFDQRSRSYKTSILLTTGNESGALLKVLELFYEQNISLTMLHSTFVPNTDFKMRFWLEFESALTNPKTQTILSQIQANGNKVEILGNYNKDPAH